MLMRVLLLGGAGRFGLSTGRRLAASVLVSKLTIAGRNQDALARSASEIGDKARAVQLDARDEGRVATLAAGCDIVVSAAGPDFEVHLPALRGALAAGVHYCDLGGDGSIVERQLELNSMARDRNVVAVVGMGTNPGFNNLLAVHASRKFDRVEEVQLCTFWHLPSTFNPVQVLDKIRKTGSVDAMWQTVLNLARGPVRMYRDGRWIATEPVENPIDVPLPYGGAVTAYPVGTPEPMTLPRYLPGVRNVSSVWSLFPLQLNEPYLREGQRISHGEVTPAEAVRSFFETIVADPDRWLQMPSGYPSGFNVWVVATGFRDRRRARYICWPVRMPTSASAALTVASLKILRGDVSVRGVLPPEACFEPMSFFEEAARYAKEEDRDKPLLGESLEWLS